jgi:hypothetical protein
MESLIFRGRPDSHNACDQWTLVSDTDDPLEFVVQERLSLEALQSGKPYLRLIRRMTVREFMSTEQPSAVKRRLQALLDSRAASSPS